MKTAIDLLHRKEIAHILLGMRARTDFKKQYHRVVVEDCRLRQEYITLYLKNGSRLRAFTVGE